MGCCPYVEGIDNFADRPVLHILLCLPLAPQTLLAEDRFAPQGGIAQETIVEQGVSAPMRYSMKGIQVRNASHLVTPKVDSIAVSLFTK